MSRVQLFKHQVSGVEWLTTRPRAGLFDDQGLGKTITAIVAADLLSIKRILVLVPTVAAYNWLHELRMWSSGRRVQLVLSARDPIDLAADVVVVTHGLVFVSEVNKQLYGFELTIIDEAQNMRNPTAKRTKAVYLGPEALVRRTPYVWPLTGTPTPNNPTEIWSALAGVDPERLRDKTTGKLLSYTQWRDRFCVMAPSGYGNGFKIIGIKNAPELRERLGSFGLRRLKKDVLKDLPPLRYGTVALTVDAKDLASLPKTLIEFDDVNRLDPDELLEDMKRNESFARWRRLCGLAKLNAAIELMRADLDSGMQKVILVAHHRDVIDGLVHGLTEFGATSITGDVPPLVRQNRVKAFQTDPGVRVIVLQIQAGGTAITLTEASDVVFVEQSPVPGENAQVADRAHRIGQTKSVLVRFLYLPGSVDEVFVDILARKTQMIREMQL